MAGVSGDEQPTGVIPVGPCGIPNLRCLPRRIPKLVLRALAVDATRGCVKTAVQSQHFHPRRTDLLEHHVPLLIPPVVCAALRAVFGFDPTAPAFVEKRDVLIRSDPGLLAVDREPRRASARFHLGIVGERPTAPPCACFFPLLQWVQPRNPRDAAEHSMGSRDRRGVIRVADRRMLRETAREVETHERAVGRKVAPARVQLFLYPYAPPERTVFKVPFEQVPPRRRPAPKHQRDGGPGRDHCIQAWRKG